MSGDLALALLSGIGIGLGLWVLVSLVPRIGRASLVHRLAPHLADVSLAARELAERSASSPLPVLGTLVPVQSVQLLAERIGAATGSATALGIRLRRAGLSVDAGGFRMRQLITGAAALAAAGAVSVLAGTPSNAAGGTALAVLAGLLGFAGPEWWLNRRAAARVARIRSQLPTVLEFLSLSLDAGEGVGPALDRVSQSTGGELAGELRRAVQRTHTGIPLVTALTELGAELAVPALSRALDQFVGALERGSPLAEVLRAHAGDAREDAKRELLELAGRKEVAMMVPLVFLILPLSVLFAVYPGVFVLSLGV